MCLNMGCVVGVTKYCTGAPVASAAASIRISLVYYDHYSKLHIVATGAVAK